MPRCALYWLLIGFSLFGLVGGLLSLPYHFSLLDLLRLLAVFGMVPLTAAVWLARNMPAIRLRMPPALLMIPIAAGVAVSLRSIQAFPNFSATDEAIIYDYVDTFTRTGQVYASLVPYDAPTVTGNLYVYGAARWVSLFPGEPYALRNLSMMGGLVLLGVVFLVGRALGGALSGGIAAALLATNLYWLAVAHVGRQEIWLAASVWAAVWLSLEARSHIGTNSGTLLALSAGALVALSADVHPLGVYACVALGAWWIYCCIQTRARRAAPLQVRRLLAAFVIGGVAGTMYYVVTHVLPDPARFFAAIGDEAVSYGAEGWTPPAALVARHLKYLTANPLELALLVGGSVWTARRGYGQGLGVFLGVLLALYGLTVADPNLYYPIVWITGMVILTAVALRHASARWQASLVVLLAAAFILNAVLVERHVQANWNGQALDALRQVAAVIPPDERGTGESVLYLVMRDPRLIGFTFVHFQAAALGVEAQEVIDVLQPGWIITMTDETAFEPAFGYMSADMPHMRLGIPDATLAGAYDLRETVVTSVGRFEIWRKQVS